MYPDVKLWVDRPDDVKGYNKLGWFEEIYQGKSGDCYLLASLSTIATRPHLIKEAFVQKETNKAGVYTIKFHIRGKPWLITIDDLFQFEHNNIFNPIFSSKGPNFLFGRLSHEYPSLWAPLLEKAYAKYVGNFVNLTHGN